MFIIIRHWWLYQLYQEVSLWSYFKKKSIIMYIFFFHWRRPKIAYIHFIKDLVDGCLIGIFTTSLLFHTVTLSTVHICISSLFFSYMYAIVIFISSHQKVEKMYPLRFQNKTLVVNHVYVLLVYSSYNKFYYITIFWVFCECIKKQVI